MKILLKNILSLIALVNMLLMSYLLNAQPLASQQQKIDSLITQGRTEFEKGNNTLAFNNFSTARKFSKQLKFNEQYIAASVELANYYMMLGEPNKAEEMIRQIAIKPAYSPELKCRYYHRKAFIYNQVGMTDSAIIFSKDALQIAKENELRSANGVIFNELGSLYEKKRVYDSSLYFYDKALLSFDSATYDYANASYNKARTLFLAKKLDRARNLLENWITEFKAKSWWNLNSPAHFYLAQVYFQQKDSFQGYRNLALSHESEIYFMRDLHSRELKKLQVAYETEEKNIEILEQKALIKHEQTDKKNLLLFVVFLSVLLFLFLIFFVVVRQKNSKLKKLNQENEFLLGELNHRTKNNLQLILSLISRELSKKDKKEMDALRNISSKIESISTLHQQLYLTDEKASVDAKKYISALIKNLAPIYSDKNIQVDYKIDATINIPVSKSIYLGLLLNELLVNSIKHAFEEDQEQKQIDIHILKEKKDNIQLIYSDNGVGIRGNDKPKLLDLLCRQLKTDYKINSSNGFNFQTTFQL